MVVVFLSLSIPILDCHHTWCCCGTPSDFYCATQTWKRQAVDTIKIDKEPINNLNTPQLKNGLMKCGTYTQWSITQQKKDNIMKFAGKRKKLENIIVSEVTQTQKDKYGCQVELFIRYLIDNYLKPN
ncbi:hypothetical protein STEG23_023922 [Scotinomys teguina]